MSDDAALVQLLADFVACDTQNPGGDEAALVARLRPLLQALHPDACMQETFDLDDGRKTAYIMARFGKPRLLFNVHLDTVRAGPDWQHDPLTLRTAAATHVGLGVADTKGALAAVVHALRSCEGGPRDCAVLFSGDEENTNACLPRFLERCDSVRGAKVIVCEPTELQVGVRHRGIMCASISLDGPGGHSCLSDTTVAPVAALSTLAQVLRQWSQSYTDATFPGMCCNITGIASEADFNVIPRQARLDLSLRPPPGVAQTTVVQALQTCIDTHAYGAHLHVRLALPSFVASDDRVIDAPLRRVDLGFWTEAALFAQAGFETVVLGPGATVQAHRPNEALPHAQLRAAAELFTRLLRQ